LIFVCSLTLAILFHYSSYASFSLLATPLISYNNAFSSLKSTMNIQHNMPMKGVQFPTSNVRGCKEDTPPPHHQSIQSVSTLRRKGNRKPTRFREAPDHLVKLPKKGHRYISKAGKPLWDARYMFPPRRTENRKRRSRALPKNASPSVEQTEQTKPTEPIEPVSAVGGIESVGEVGATQPAAPIKRPRIKLRLPCKYRAELIGSSKSSSNGKDPEHFCGFTPDL
jgi:hypothetical protein